MSFNNDKTVPSQQWFGQLISNIARSTAEVEASDIREAIGSSVNGRNHKQIRMDILTWTLSFQKDE